MSAEDDSDEGLATFEAQMQAMRDFDAQLQAVQQTARSVFASICPLLEERGVERVCIAYDGYGDSGAVESVTATKGKDEIELPGDVVDQLTTAAEELLPCGWENGEGAFGELVLDVAARTLSREHSSRYIETDYEEECFEL